MLITEHNRSHNSQHHTHIENNETPQYTAIAPENSIPNRYNVDHYQKLLSYKGTKLVDSFNSLDNSIKEYLENPKLDNEGRGQISKKFAGFSDKSSSDRITDRILKLLDGGNGRI